jgi:hypothetical protein
LPLFVLQTVITKFPWQCKVPYKLKHSVYTLVSDQGIFHGQLPVFTSPRLTGKKYTLQFNVPFISCSINDGSSEHIKFILSSAASQWHILNNLLLHGITRRQKTSNTRYRKLDECNMHLGVNHWPTQSEFTVKTSSWNRLLCIHLLRLKQFLATTPPAALYKHSHGLHAADVGK